MRFFLLALLTAAAGNPLISQAQDDFAAGTYELADGTKGAGQLDYQVTSSHPKLVVKDGAADPNSKAGKKGVAYSPEQVRAFTIGDKHYTVLHNIRLDSGMPMTMSMTKKEDFAQVVEAGKLELLEYQFIFGTMGHFGNPANSTRQRTTVYVLHKQGEDKADMVPVMGKKYHEVVAGYLAGRPDLIQKVGNKPTSSADLVALVKQYNAAP